MDPIQTSESVLHAPALIYLSLDYMMIQFFCVLHTLKKKTYIPKYDYNEWNIME